MKRRFSYIKNYGSKLDKKIKKISNFDYAIMIYKAGSDIN